MKEQSEVEENHLAQQCNDGELPTNNDNEKKNTFYSIRINIRKIKAACTD